MAKFETKEAAKDHLYHKGWTGYGAKNYYFLQQFRAKIIEADGAFWIVEWEVE